ncbi:MAG: VTT domain-containing protein [Oscillospiraceae bacterium]
MLTGTRGGEMLTNYAPKNTALAVVVALLAYAVKSQTVFVLYGVVATAVGIVFEPPLSLIVNAVGSVICISVPYFTGRASGGEAAHKLLAKYKKLGEVYEGNRDNLFLVSLVLRVTNLSNDILGLFFGALRMDYWQYLASSFIGILPTMVLYTVLGSDLDPTIHAGTHLCWGGYRLHNSGLVRAEAQEKEKGDTK